MRPPFTLIVFARQPHFGVGKTRLAARRGKWQAWQFQRRQTRLFARLGQDPRWRLRVRWAHQQGPGDLGARLNRALNQALGRTPGQPTLIVGGDTLGVNKGHIAQAFETLKARPYALGPSPDGGFWCIGARKPLRLGKVRWSSAHALCDVVAQLKNVSTAPSLADLD